MDELFKTISKFEGLNDDTKNLINTCKKIKNSKNFLNLSYEDYDAFKDMVNKYMENYFNEETKDIDLVKGKDGDQFLFRQVIRILSHF